MKYGYKNSPAFKGRDIPPGTTVHVYRGGRFMGYRKWNNGSDYGFEELWGSTTYMPGWLFPRLKEPGESEPASFLSGS